MTLRPFRLVISCVEIHCVDPNIQADCHVPLVGLCDVYMAFFAAILRSS